MSFRKEQKIVINPNKIFEFKKWLTNFKAKELFEPRYVNSVYFDNNYFGMYKDSIEGTLPRKKIRFRTYGEVFNFKNELNKEIKISSVDGRFKKSKKVKDHLKYFNNGFFDQEYGICFPVLNVFYKRRYFKLGNVRVTIDENIAYKRINKTSLSCFCENETLKVIELKCAEDFDENKLIRNFPFDRKRFSKYCNGIEKIYKLN